MFYTVYKITNLVNDKIYIGVHKTSDLSDDYMGSGKLIHQAIEKYGIENFKKEYISIFDNPEQMFKMESEIVNEDFVQRTDTYNLKQGGFGGFDYINSMQNTTELKIKGGKVSSFKIASEILKDKYNDVEWFNKKIESLTYARSKLYEKYTNGVFYGKTHSKESRKKIGEANSKHQSGEGNSQYGKMWIHNLELKESKRISKEEEIPEGWLKGRKMKF